MKTKKTYIDEIYTEGMPKIKSVKIIDSKTKKVLADNLKIKHIKNGIKFKQQKPIIIREGEQLDICIEFSVSKPNQRINIGSLEQKKGKPLKFKINQQN